MSTSSRDTTFSAASRGSGTLPTSLAKDIPHSLAIAILHKPLTPDQRATYISHLSPCANEVNVQISVDVDIGALAFVPSIRPSLLYPSRAQLTGATALASMKDVSMKRGMPSFNPLTGEALYAKAEQPIEGEEARPIPCYVFCRGHGKTQQTGDWNWRAWKADQIAQKEKEKNGLKRSLSISSVESSDLNASWSTIASSISLTSVSESAANATHGTATVTGAETRSKPIKFKRQKVRTASTISLLTRQIRKANGQEALEREGAERGAEWAKKMGLGVGDMEGLPSAFDDDSDSEEDEDEDGT